MNRLIEKLRRFMYGRYGSDQLQLFISILIVALCVVNLFVGTLFISIPVWLLFAYSIFRMLSRNLNARAKENRVFLSVWTPVSRFFTSLFSRIKDTKTHAYRKCKACKATLRLPRRRGKHTVVCPKCGNRFEVNIH